MTYKGYASNHLFSYASLSQQTEFVTHLYQEQNPQVYTDTRSLHVGLKTPQTPGDLPLDLTGRTTLSQSNPVVNSKARFQPARGLIFRQATPSLVRSRGDQQHSLTFDSIRVWILLLGTSSRYLERGPTILLPRSPAPVSSTRCTVSTETMCSKGVTWRYCFAHLLLPREC